MLKAAIFDMDGLMFDTEPIWDKAFLMACEKNGVGLRREFRDSTIGVSGVVLANMIEEEYGAGIDGMEFVNYLNTEAYNMFLAGAPKKPGLDNILNYLKDRGIKCIIASSSEIRTIEAHWNANGLDEWFEGIASGQQVKRSKPYPDVFLLAADKLGVDPSEAVVFEDSNAGVTAGVAGGFKTIMIPDIKAPTAESQANATAICNTLDDAIDIVENL